MSAVYDVGINLASAAIGVFAGIAWTHGVKKVKYRRHRAFWRFLERPTAFVVGDLETKVLLGTLSQELEQLIGQEEDRLALVERITSYINSQEASGLVGRGDLEAIVRMAAKFAELRLPAKLLILHPNQVREQRYQNLVLIGGNDVNSLTGALSRRMGCRLEAITNEEDRNVIRDSRLNVDYPVAWQGEPNPDGEILRVDYGVLARGSNPDDPKSEVLLIAGAHGLGSMAAAEVSLSPEFAPRLYHDLKEYNGNFECLIRYTRIDGGPYDGHVTINLEFSRSLDGQPAKQ